MKFIFCYKITRGNSSFSADLISDIGFGKYQAMVVFITFMGYFAKHSIMDMMPVLSTRLYVQFDWTPELESALGAATFAGQTLSYLLTGLLASRVGRKTCTVFGMVWTVSWTVLWSFSWSIESLIAIRLISSLGVGESNLMSLSLRILM